MASNDDSIVLGLVMLFGGPVLFWQGFVKLKKQRMIENIPTSTVRGMAMGMVELKGKVYPCSETFSGPFTGQECVFFKYTVEEYRSSGKSGRWVVISQGASEDIPFFINDDTGKVLVCAKGSELHLTKKLVNSGKLTDEIQRSLNAWNIKTTGFLGIRRQLRVTEWHLKPEEEVYVLGSAKKNEDIDRQNKEKLIKKLQELKSDPQLMKEVDLDKDGKVSLEEWDIARKKIEMDILSRSINKGVNDHADIVVGKPKNKGLFILADKSEKDLVKSFSFWSKLSIIGGPILCVLGLLYTLYYFKIKI